MLDFTKILDENTLNLYRTEKRLILKALVKTGFKVKEAWILNCEGTMVTQDAYNKKVAEHFQIKTKDLKKQFEEYITNKKKK